MKTANAKRDLRRPNLLIICTSLRTWERSFEPGAYVQGTARCYLIRFYSYGKGLLPRFNRYGSTVYGSSPTVFMCPSSLLARSHRKGPPRLGLMTFQNHDFPEP